MHQIEYYWELKQWTESIEIYSSPKDWNQKATKRNAAFKAILDDPSSLGQLGIYVCKSGYQQQ